MAATVTLSIVTGASSASATITLTSTDANRIFTAYQAIRPGATLSNLTQYFAQQLIASATRLVQNNVTIPSAPAMTPDGSP